MDFLKILKSFEEFIYEVLSWLVFYPRTLWRVTLRPIRMARYAETELSDPLRSQFNDALINLLLLVIPAALNSEAGQAGIALQQRRWSSSDVEFQALEVAGLPAFGC